MMNVRTPLQCKKGNALLFLDQVEKSHLSCVALEETHFKYFCTVDCLAILSGMTGISSKSPNFPNFKAGFYKRTLVRPYKDIKGHFGF